MINIYELAKETLKKRHDEALKYKSDAEMKYWTALNDMELLEKLFGVHEKIDCKDQRELPVFRGACVDTFQVKPEGDK